jgi:hypothetical protein
MKESEILFVGFGEKPLENKELRKLAEMALLSYKVLDKMESRWAIVWTGKILKKIFSRVGVDLNINEKILTLPKEADSDR